MMRRRSAALRQRLATTRMPRGLETSPEVDEWSVIGEPADVADKLAQYGEALHATHIIVAHLRVAGVDESSLRDSVARVTDLLV